MFARLFGLLWIGAALASVYFLYVSIVDGAPWTHLILSVIAVLVAKTVALIFDYNYQRTKYIGQLIDRGYERAKAEAAWRTASEGGMNVLRDLQQAEVGGEATQLNPAMKTTDSEPQETDE